MFFSFFCCGKIEEQPPLQFDRPRALCSCVPTNNVGASNRGRGIVLQFSLFSQLIRIAYCAGAKRCKYLEQLHADDGEHELQQVRDQHDIADRLDRHYHTLDHILRVFVLVFSGLADGGQEGGGCGVSEGV